MQEALFQNNIRISEIRNDDESHPSNNIGPTKNAPVYFNEINNNEQIPVLQFMMWGLIPIWTKSKEELKKNSYSTFNARVESIAKGNKLWSSVRRNRCVIPIKGYYEWEHKIDERTKKEVKIPYFISRKDGKLLFLVGFWSHSKLKDSNRNDIYSFTVITGPATNELSSIHHRIPIIIEPNSKEWDAWLNLKDWDDKLLESLKACNDGILKWYEVSKDVGKISNDGDYLTKPVKREIGALDTFFTKSNELKEVKKEDKEVKKEDKQEDIKEIKNERPNIKKQNSPKKQSPNKSSKKRKADINQPSIFDLHKKMKKESKT